MANNLIKLGSETLIDLTGDTVAPSNLLSGYTAHDKSGAAISGGVQSGTVALTLTPSNLTPSATPNKYVTSASASLDYSSLTAEAANVLQGMTFIGKNGYETGSLQVSPFQTGVSQSSGETTLIVTGLTGTPSNIILISTANVGSSYFSSVFLINGSNGGFSGGSFYTTGWSTVFDHANGKCTFTKTGSATGRKFATGKDYRYVVW